MVLAEHAFFQLEGFGGSHGRGRDGAFEFAFVDSRVAQTLCGMAVALSKHVTAVIVPQRTIPNTFPLPMTITHQQSISVFSHQVITSELRPRAIPRNDSQLLPAQPILLVVDAIGRHAAVLGR